MTLWTRVARFLTPFDHAAWVKDDPYATANAMPVHQSARRDISQRLWLIENRQESLRHEIETAKRRKRATRHLTDEMQRLTTERLTLERANG